MKKKQQGAHFFVTLMSPLLKVILQWYEALLDISPELGLQMNAAHNFSYSVSAS